MANARNGVPIVSGDVLLLGGAARVIDSPMVDRVLAVAGGQGQHVTAAEALHADRILSVRKNSGAIVGHRRQLNLIEGTGATLTVADDAATGEIDVMIAADGGGSGLSHPQVLARTLGA